MHLHNVGVLESGGRLRFGSESRQFLGLGPIGGQEHLECDNAVELELAVR